MIQQSGLASVLTDVIILAAMTVVTIVVAIVKFKKNES